MSLPSRLSRTSPSKRGREAIVTFYHTPQQRGYNNGTLSVSTYTNDIIYYYIMCNVHAVRVYRVRGAGFPSKVHRGCSTYAPGAGSGRPSFFQPARQADWCFFFSSEIPLYVPIQLYIISSELLLCANQSGQCEKKIIFPPYDIVHGGEIK